jgi:hypothetical protein
MNLGLPHSAENFARWSTTSFLSKTSTHKVSYDARSPVSNLLQFMQNTFTMHIQEQVQSSYQQRQAILDMSTYLKQRENI